MIYDKIFVGGSLSTLIKCIELHDNILIIEKKNFLGGAWCVGQYKNYNIELGIHLIVPPNNSYLKKFNEYFNEYNIYFEKLHSKDFYYETETFKSYGKEGDSLICKNGWSDFFFKIEKLIKLKKNITIIFNEEVCNINIKNDLCYIKTNKAVYYSNKVILPCYCTLDKIIYENKIIKMNYDLVYNYHYVVEIDKIKSNITKNFQGFYDKEPLDIYDRVSIISLTPNILLVRLSKPYKKKVETINLLEKTKRFLLKNNLIYTDTNIINIVKKEYLCYYRDEETRNKIINSFSLLDKNKVEFMETQYMGHFLASYCDNLI